MRAIVQDRYGTADVLTPAVIDPPEPGAHDVLDRARTAAHQQSPTAATANPAAAGAQVDSVAT